jgi:GMP synthase (glutamine-hydrolysing)
MRKVLVLQHVAWENLSTLEPLLRKGGFRTRYVNFERESDVSLTIDKYNGLFILGGPMGVYEKEKYSHIKTELLLTEQALKADIPILGICFGAQILAHVLGSQVRKHTRREMAWNEVQVTEHAKEDPILGHFKPSEYVFQSHGDTFDVPKNTVHLARSKVCEGQAFRYGDKVYGFQFHLEANQAYVDRWISLPANVKYMKSPEAQCSVESVVSDTKKYLAHSMDLSFTAFTNFLKTFGDFNRNVVLGSEHGRPPKE